MTEKELLGHVVAQARLRHWKVAHFHTVQAIVGGRRRWMTPVAADGKGFPDLLLVRERVLAVEIKGGGHKPTPEQDAWLMAFRLAGVRVAVFQPRDLDNGAIEAELSERLPYRPVELVELFGREGIVTVCDDEGKYLGCMGRETWNALLPKVAT